MGSFKWKKVVVPIGNDLWRSVKVNRLSNHQLLRIATTTDKLWMKVMRKHFKKGKRQAIELAHSRGML